MNRREYLRTAAATTGALAIAGAARGRARAAGELPEPTPEKLPRWRGFNLLSMFQVSGREQSFPAQDFELVAELGFNFVRLPLDYRFWVDSSDWIKVRGDVLERIDQAVEFGRRHDVHVQINFHRAPGYTVARPAEPRSLWSDPAALDACAAHWSAFAARYRSVPNKHVSFNLLNEPDNRVRAEDHRRVVERLVAAIREQDSDRLIVCDGRSYARTPPDELVGLNVAASMHGYDPHRLTHYRAGWVEGSDRWPEPTWPLTVGDATHDREWLRREGVEPWKRLEARGVGVHVGEFGSHNRTPHPVVLAWMRDCLSLWNSAGWGWALWNLRGSFGILDSGRGDVSYEDFRGHKLDRKMLDVLRGEG